MIQLSSPIRNLDLTSVDEDRVSRAARNNKKVLQIAHKGFSELDGKSSNVLTNLEFAVDTTHVTPKVPEGIYEAVFVRVEQATVFKTSKIFVWVRIITPGPAFGVELFRPYRAHFKPGKQKQLFLKPRSELRLMLCRVTNGDKVRADRVSLAVLKNKVLTVKVRTVTKDYRQRPLNEMDQYSVIEDIISIETS